ncbi:MAG TPA: type II toxin-antitoxin system HicA family toxin [Chitinophagales bacterium]|nr:type II toxin-antitoxin system HicA family toxin [Chitinophagales bacterium]HRK26345.1 type II toxin-antitoxin system HicA family toxin [Chitinophagales bacterium]
MKKQHLEKHLKEQGCKLMRQGKSHEIWVNPENKCQTTIPRHKEIDNVLCKIICKQLGIIV